MDNVCNRCLFSVPSNNNYDVFIQLVYKFTFDFEFLDFSSIFSIFCFSYLVGRELGS